MPAVVAGVWDLYCVWGNWYSEWSLNMTMLSRNWVAFKIMKMAQYWEIINNDFVQCCGICISNAPQIPQPCAESLQLDYFCLIIQCCDQHYKFQQIWSISHEIRSFIACALFCWCLCHQLLGIKMSHLSIFDRGILERMGKFVDS